MHIFLIILVFYLNVGMRKLDPDFGMLFERSDIRTLDDIHSILLNKSLAQIAIDKRMFELRILRYKLYA